MYIDFEYANKRASDFDCVVGHFNTDSGIQESDIGCDITFTTVKNKHSSVHSVTSSSYENVYIKTFEIFKKPCGKNLDHMYFSVQEFNAITKWLNRRTYHKFRWYDSDIDTSRLYYMGSFNVKENRMGGRIISLTLTFTASTPYAFEDDVVLDFSTSEINETISVFADSDEYGVIYPTVKITCLAGGDLKITNITTSNYIYIANCASGETITMDGEHKIILTDNTFHQKTLYNDFNYEFLDIENDDYCENVYEVSLPCNISMMYAPIRKTGV